jgi:hypothetical protein
MAISNKEVSMILTLPKKHKVELEEILINAEKHKKKENSISKDKIKKVCFCNLRENGKHEETCIYNLV